MTRIRGVIFDLDDTLFDCTGLLTEPARERAAAILHEHHPNTPITDLVDEQSDLSNRVGSTQAIRDIGLKHQLSPDVIESATNAYNQDAVGPIEPFPEAPRTIEALLARNVRVSLVTTGRKNRQIAKVQALGLSGFFDLGTNLFIHEPSTHPDKTPVLITAQESMNLEAPEILSVGDKLDADVAVGNRLGFITARFRHGRQKDLDPGTADEHPNHDLQNLSQILDLAT